MRAEQEARGAEAPAPAGGGNTAAKGHPTYTDEVQRVGALLRGEKPKKEPSTPKVDSEAKPDNAEDQDHAGDEAARADQDKGGETRGDKGQPGADDTRGRDQGEDTARGGEGEAGEPERITPAELARALGVKGSEIYEQLAVDVELTDPHGVKSTQSVTLGDLRRGYRDAETLRSQRDTFEQERDAQSLEAMQSRRYFERVAHAFAPYVPKDVIALVNQERAERIERERALLYAAVPDWKDPAKHAADRTAMIAYLKPWGFSAADVAAIEDHRVARCLRDHMNAARRTREAEDRARKAKQTGGASAETPTPGRTVTRPQNGLALRVRSIIEQGKAAKTTAEKVTAVADLLNAHASSSSSARRER
jgi:hypothetical protein